MPAAPRPGREQIFHDLQLAVTFHCCARTPEEADLIGTVLSCPDLHRVPKVSCRFISSVPSADLMMHAFLLGLCSL